MRQIYNLTVTCVSLAIISVLTLIPTFQVLAENETAYSQYRSGEKSAKPAGGDSYTVISVSTEEELAALAENCQIDVWSGDKYVQLENDISLKEYTELTIPSFSGVFDGGGHRISNLEITRAGSAQGLFRYIQETGVVKNLEVSGRVTPEGTRSQVGVVAGVNFGQITNCTVYGSIVGSQDVGGIAGINEKTGEIRNCQSAVMVVGDHSAGGICGTNNGTLNGCKNFGGININSTEVELGLEDLTMENLEDLNSTANMEAHTDTGGIAGYSEGKIYNCSNSGTVGYPHVGYNTGGIVGRLHQGYIQNCSNTGHIMGRKDVGGIAGQMEPFLEIQYLNDSLNEVDAQAEKLFDLLEALHEDISGYGSRASDLAKEATNSLRNANAAASELIATANELWYIYNQELMGVSSDLERLNGELGDLADSDQTGERPGFTVSSGDPQESGSGPLGDILGSDGDLQIPDISESTRTEISAALRRFGDSTVTHMDNITTATGDRSGGITDNLNTLNAEMDHAGSSLQQLADVLEQGVDEVSADMDALISQCRILYRSLGGLRNDLFRYENVEIIDDSDEMPGALTEDGEVQPTAYYDTSTFQQGKVTLCVNRGLVEADNSVGGIVGQVATEYDFDPEEDLTISGPESFNIERTVKAVIRESKNFGDVVGKRDYAGGVVGRADYGAIISCESYGAVRSTGGSYVGGIAGSSSYCIRNSYAMGQLSGKNYVGGIAGKGCDVFYSYAYPSIEITGECGGSIAGQLKEEGILSGNYYVQGNMAGVDSIGYEGGATPLTYEEFCSSKGVPAAFSTFTVSFQAEGRELASFQCHYGEEIDPDLIPEIPEKEGFYGRWPEFDYTCVTGNRVLEAQYEKWVSSLASSEQDESGKAKVLVQGEFLPEMQLELTETAEGTAITITGLEEAGEYAGPVTVRALCDNPENMIVELYENGGYRQVSAETMGSYLGFPMECPGTFRLVTKAENNKRKLGTAAGAVGLGLLVALIVRGIGKMLGKRHRASKEKL